MLKRIIPEKTVLKKNNPQRIIPEKQAQEKKIPKKKQGRGTREEIPGKMQEKSLSGNPQKKAPENPTGNPQKKESEKQRVKSPGNPEEIPTGNQGEILTGNPGNPPGEAEGIVTPETRTMAATLRKTAVIPEIPTMAANPGARTVTANLSARTATGAPGARTLTGAPDARTPAVRRTAERTADVLKDAAPRARLWKKTEKNREEKKMRETAETADLTAASGAAAETNREDLTPPELLANPLVKPGERIDDLQRAGLRIIQDPALFCFGMDAVLLSSYVQMKKARRGLDLGTGNGIIPILLSDRTDCASLTGLEIQPASVDLALRSVALNGLQDRISIVSGDIREAGSIFAAASFDFITCNPPYRPVGTGRITGNACVKKDTGCSDGPHRIAENACVKEDTCRSDGPHRITGNACVKGDGAQSLRGTGLIPDPRAIARHELLCTFDDVAEAAAKLVRPGGHFYLVHRPMRLAQIISKLCDCGLEPKRMRLVYPHVDQAPNMVLLDCVRGGAPELRVEPPLIVYGEDGKYTRELREIYKS